MGAFCILTFITSLVQILSGFLRNSLMIMWNSAGSRRIHVIVPTSMYFIFSFYGMKQVDHKIGQGKV